MSQETKAIRPSRCTNCGGPFLQSPVVEEGEQGWACISCGYFVALDDHYCRECGCTTERACFGGCYWVEGDLCSSCKPGSQPARGDLW